LGKSKKSLRRHHWKWRR